MTDLYSPTLTEYIVNVAQYNIQAYNLLESIITDATANKPQLLELIALGISQNKDTLKLLTSKPKESTIN